LIGGVRLRIEKIPVTKIKPAKYNPRKDLKPGDPAYEKLKRSMTEFGYVEPIIWNEETGNIVGGHQRYKILLEAGHTEVECVVVKLSADKEKALNLALNKVTGDWEIEALADLLHELNEQDFDLTLTGFDAAEIEDLFSQVHDKDVTDDDFDLDKALEEEPVSKPASIGISPVISSSATTALGGGAFKISSMLTTCPSLVVITPCRSMV
jgi:ParB-like chromosome segregation protein Spo0J